MRYILVILLLLCGCRDNVIGSKGPGQEGPKTCKNEDCPIDEDGDWEKDPGINKLSYSSAW